ncbi:type II toxin-antitoxin system VapC family toxin [Moorella sulfitireducens]|uniref:type II toxin-antitoxin system VapC family toxin n=1 Tax=Neomoorella sulfitireducens TaxID=2972948 RepID=UPI0021ACD3CF|nr:PIN domain-containing protein [Moorella sulfitireducens]
MKKVFIDTGAWYALKNKKDTHHRDAVRFFQNLAGKVVCYTSDYVIDEAITLTRIRLKNHQVAATLAEELLSEKAARVVFVAPDFLSRALEIFREFKDQDFSFTDCTSFAIMESLGIEEALAFDTHFTFEKFGLRQIVSNEY